MHSSIMLTLTSKANWRVVNYRSLSVHHGRIYANVGSFVSQNIPHHTPLAVKNMFHQYLALTEHKNWSPPIIWNECPFLSLFHTSINTRMDLPRLLSLLYSHGAATLSRSKDILLRLCASECCTSFPSFSVVQSPQCLVACRGLSTCSYKTHHTLSTVSHNKLALRSFNAYWTIEHDRVWE